MRNRQKTLFRFLPAILSLLLALGSATVFSACGIKEDGTWMRCHSAQAIVTIIATVLTCILLLQAVLSKKGFRMALSTVSIAGCVVVFLLPGTLQPMCMMRTMRCYTVMQPFVRIMAVLIGCSSVFQLIRMLKGEAKS